jgi:hypothetical protein
LHIVTGNRMGRTRDVVVHTLAKDLAAPLVTRRETRRSLVLSSLELERWCALAASAGDPVHEQRAKAHLLSLVQSVEEPADE